MRLNIKIFYLKFVNVHQFVVVIIVISVISFIINLIIYQGV